MPVTLKPAGSVKSIPGIKWKSGKGRVDRDPVWWKSNCWVLDARMNCCTSSGRGRSSGATNQNWQPTADPAASG